MRAQPDIRVIDWDNIAGVVLERNEVGIVSAEMTVAEAMEWFTGLSREAGVDIGVG